MKYLLVGLGNPGAAYEGTRHNVGYALCDLLARGFSADFEPARYGWIATVRYRGRSLRLLKPSTYMNLSGRALGYHLRAWKCPLTQLLVLVDDLALPLGRWRLRIKGSDGGHNGLRHIAETLKSEHYARLRIGIGGKGLQAGGQSDYVLASFEPEEQQRLAAVLEEAREVALSFCVRGVQETLNRMGAS